MSRTGCESGAFPILTHRIPMFGCLFPLFSCCLSRCSSTAFAKEQWRFRSKWPLEVIWKSYTPVQAGPPTAACLGLYLVRPWISLKMRIHSTSGQPMRIFGHSRKLSCSDRISGILICSYCLLSCHGAPLRGACLSSLLPFRHLYTLGRSPWLFPKLSSPKSHCLSSDKRLSSPLTISVVLYHQVHKSNSLRSF